MLVKFEGWIESWHQGQERIQNNVGDKKRNLNINLQDSKTKQKGEVSLNKFLYLGEDAKTSKDSITLKEFENINRVFTA